MEERRLTPEEAQRQVRAALRELEKALREADRKSPPWHPDFDTMRCTI